MTFSLMAHALIGLLMILHGLFAICALLGAALLFAWAIKHLSAQKLKHLGVWLLSMGIVGALLTMVLASGTYGMGGHRGMKGSWGTMDGKGRMMQGWEEIDVTDGDTLSPAMMQKK